MKSLFIDTNILIDLIADRRPFSKFAIDIFKSAENQEVKLYTSSHAYATTHYLLKKHLSEKELREILFSLLTLVNIIAVDFNIVQKSLLSKHKDFEDAIQMFAANSISDMDCIVTRNLKDYKGAGLLVLPPDEVMQYLRN